MAEEKKLFIKDSIIDDVLDDFLKPYACFDFKVKTNDKEEVYKDKNMAYCFAIFRLKTDKTIRVGLVRYNWRTGYVHAIIPLPISHIEEFIEALKKAFKLRDKIDAKLKLEEAKKSAERFLEELPPEEAEILREFIEKELEKKKRRYRRRLEVI